jgi:transaldolase
MTEGTTALDQVADAGVAVWLDDLSRERLRTGNLKDLVARRRVVGVTTNPTIFASALAKGDAYDEQLKQLAAQGTDVDGAVFSITTDDVRDAADILRPVYDATDGRGRPRVDRGRPAARPRRAGDGRRGQAAVAGRPPEPDDQDPATKDGLPAISEVIGRRHQRQRHADLLPRALPRGHGRLRHGPGEGAEAAGTTSRRSTPSPPSSCPGSTPRSTSGRDRHGRGGRAEGQGRHRERAPRVRGVYEEVFAGERWRSLAAAGAKPSSARCGPRRASRTRRTRTPCTSTSSSRRHGEHDAGGHAEGRRRPRRHPRRHRDRHLRRGAAPTSTAWRRWASPTTRSPTQLEDEGVAKFEKAWPTCSTPSAAACEQVAE